MKNRFLGIVAFTLVLTGCAVESLRLGTPRDEVIKKFGKPTAVVSLASGTRLQYSLQPEGRSAVMVDVDAADKVVSVRQVLNTADFSRVVVGKWTRQDVEREFGRPARIDHVANWRGDILTYRWLDGGQNMLFNVYLDPNNVAQSVGQREERPDDELRLFRLMGQHGL
ncbi:MAG: hypothetical protein ABL923_01755 [Burkholderiaceae bacterium]